MRRSKRRWSDDDRHFGPITYAPNARCAGFTLDSGDDEYRGCCIRLHAFKRTLIVELPPIVWPRRTKVEAKSWDAETVARLGRDWYWDVVGREFGATLSEGALHLLYGAQTHDSSTDHSKCWFVPWLNWRHVRSSIYGLSGEHDRTQAKGEPWTDWHEAQDACPSVSFEFDDFDGERITAKTRIEEMEWRFGTGWFKWLSLFHSPRIRRSLDLDFSAETGKRKGSWKGGTVGHSIEMQRGELHESAFRRYCFEHEMTFIGPNTEKKETT